jgi:DNA-binding MarR family transcriptional regulator
MSSIRTAALLPEPPARRWLDLRLAVPDGDEYLTTSVITSIVSTMRGVLQRELKQTRPFRSLEEEVTLNVARTAEYLGAATSDLLKTADLTPTQYNVLRILRGAGAEGLSCSEIGERMITKESDITRLLDRVEARGFISRERPANNRRMVVTRITAGGLELLAALDAPVDELNRSLIGHLGEEQKRTLNELLERVRVPG